MRALLLTLQRRDNGHYYTTWRTQNGSRRVFVIPSGADLETAIKRIQRRLDKQPDKGK